MSNSKFYIPKHLDDPVRFLLWSLDEAVCLFVPFIIGVLFSQVLVGLICGASALFLVRRLKGSQGGNYIFNLIYWHMPLRQYYYTPPSCIREFVG